MSKQATERGIIVGEDLKRLLGAPDLDERISDVRVLPVDSGGVGKPVPVTSASELAQLGGEGRLVESVDEFREGYPEGKYLLADTGWMFRGIKRVTQATQKLAAPLVSDKGRHRSLKDVESGGVKMKQLSFALQYAFLELNGSSPKTLLLLEEQIPHRTTLAVAGEVYTRFMQDLGVQDYKPPEQLRDEMHRLGYGTVKTKDVDARIHHHKKPHWYRSLQIFRTMVALNSEDTQREIEDKIENAETKTAGRTSKVKGHEQTGKKIVEQLLQAAGIREQK